jgi:hypothetical protein
MKTIRVTNRSKAINALLAKARKEDVILKASDGSEFMVTAIDDFDHEIAAQRQNKKLMAYLDGVAKAAKKSESIPLEEVERRLGLAKKSSKNPK